VDEHKIYIREILAVGMVLYEFAQILF
jgi:hypothetical protein